MPVGKVTLTVHVQGNPYFELVGDNLQVRRGAVDRIARRVVEFGGRTAKKSLGDKAPIDRGPLKDALTFSEGPNKESDRWWMGVGDMVRLGDPTTPAPRGTIKKFVEDHNIRQGYIPNFRSELAWWYLTADQRRLLRDERLAGKYGGAPAGHAFYGWLQETGTYPAPRGAKGKWFIRDTTAELVSALRSTVDMWSWVT